MLDHLGIDVGELERSKAFYQAALAPLGYDIRKENDHGVGFGVVGGYRRSLDPAGEFWIAPGAPTPAVHYAFSAKSRAAVDAFYAAALAAGGTGNGEPGLRPQYHENYYAAFVLDPDGYNIEAVCHEAV
jgi:catechol 2,3-dioxygenase-like lactoylglutathione lyase family enzyme